jgi:uncharacterized protein (TIGR01777 family)
VDVILNLCGDNILGRWTQKKRQKIRDSRLSPTHLLVDTLLRLKKKPALYVGSTGIGYYGNSAPQIVTEDSPKGSGLLADLCQEVEEKIFTLQEEKIRCISARLGVVLGPEGGALSTMTKLFRKGLGGNLGSGEQKMSWIALDDLSRAFSWVIQHPAIEGPVNFTAPQSIINKELTRLLGEYLHRPTFCTIPSSCLRAVLLEGAEPLLGSLDVKPTKLELSGFNFVYPSINEALKKYLEIYSYFC